MTPTELTVLNLRNEIARLRRNYASASREPGEFKLIELAAARTGITPSFGYRLLMQHEHGRKPNKSERLKLRKKIRSGEGNHA